MPIYTFRCPVHGESDRLVRNGGAGCCARATRLSVYAPAVHMGGQIRDDDEMRTALRRKGWDADRAITEMRKNMVEDERGDKHLNVAGMTQVA